MSSTLIGSAIAVLNARPESAGIIQAMGQANPAATARRVGEKVRGMLLSAQRYHLSSDFTQMASLYGFNVDDPVDKFVAVARPPFQNVWLEWPVVDQLGALGIEAASNCPRFAGVLITRQSSPSRFMITSVHSTHGDEHVKDHVELAPLSIMVDTAKPIDRSEFQACYDFVDECLKGNVRVAGRGVSLDLDDREATIKAVMEGVIIGGRMGDAPDKGADMRKIIPYTSYCFTPGFHENLVRLARDYRHPMSESMKQIIVEHIGEHSGITRFVLGALALLNAKEYVKREVVKPGQKRPDEAQKPRIQPSYEFVTITAPHKVVVQYIQGSGETGTKREPMRHEVSGTWVTYHKTGKADCDHVMVKRDDSGDKLICTLCGLKRTWRRDHERGNIELGFKPRKAKVVLGE